MIIVIGTFQVEPDHREEFVANRVQLMNHSRAENGCITYSFTADRIDPRAVVLTERWTDRAAFEAHIAGLKSAPQPAPAPAHLTREIFVYQADEGKPL